jgi:hypothetical protein
VMVYRLIWFWFLTMQDFSLLHSVQTDYGAQPASYGVGTRGSFSVGTATGVWSWPLTSHSAKVKKVGAVPSLPHMSSWHSA